MNLTPEKAPLPAGISDQLPPHAAFEAEIVERLMTAFAGYGFERVKPPLIEFEDSLLGGDGAALAEQTFRLMDPISQRMLALRPDMTMQIARIAQTRLTNRPRPLRLGYAGQVVRVTGSQLRFERQFGEVGAEIIGATSPAADAEVIVMATAALRDLGMAGLTVDLGLPTLVPAILADQTLDPGSWSHIRAALDRKDEAAIANLAPVIGQQATSLLSGLVGATGRAGLAIERLKETHLPPAAAAERMELVKVFERVDAEMDDVTISIDPLENRGFEYHTGVTFTLFARDVRGELGRGGRYMAGLADGEAEPATGVTLFMDSIVRSLPVPRIVRRIFLPAGTPSSEGRRLRAEGWVTVNGLDADRAPAEQAARQRCTHVFIDGEAHTVKT